MNVCELAQIETPIERIVAAEEEVFFVIALSHLNSDSGMFALRSGNGEGDDYIPDLAPGDAIIWQRENAGRKVGGVGGLMQVIKYR